MTEKSNKKPGNMADKGQLNGSCNRTACQRPGATWFNTSTRAYYCKPCARDITDFAKRADGFHICFPSTGDADRDRAMKFGEEPTQEATDAVGAAEAEVGHWVYRRIEVLMDAAPGTPEAAELTYLAKIAESVEEYGEDACAGTSLADFPTAPPSPIP